jgi:hypothetical protein
MDVCIENNKKIAFGMKAYAKYINGICACLGYGRYIPGIRHIFDTIPFPDVRY